MVDHPHVEEPIVAHVRAAQRLRELGYFLNAIAKLRRATTLAPNHSAVTTEWAALLAAFPTFRTTITAQRDRARMIALRWAGGRTRAATGDVVSFDAWYLRRIFRCTVVIASNGTCILGVGPSDVNDPIIAAVLARARYAVEVTGRVELIPCDAKVAENNPPNFRLHLTPRDPRDRTLLRSLRTDPTRSLSAIAAVVVQPPDGEAQRVRNVYHWPAFAPTGALLAQ